VQTFSPQRDRLQRAARWQLTISGALDPVPTLDAW
jgi:hypothetical protein